LAQAVHGLRLLLSQAAEFQSSGLTLYRQVGTAEGHKGERGAKGPDGEANIFQVLPPDILRVKPGDETSCHTNEASGRRRYDRTSAAQSEQASLNRVRLTFLSRDQESVQLSKGSNNTWMLDREGWCFNGRFVWHDFPYGYAVSLRPCGS
jgi:hypothetical protein